MTTSQACVFPAELIIRILYHADIRDIVRWRTVSKRFRDFTCEAMLWKALYVNAPFPRPPGPSPSQSAAFLERTLVKSAQLAKSWTTRPMRDISLVRIKLEGKSTMPPKLICGRWLVSCEQLRRFVLHDVDAGAETHARQVLWEHEKPVVSSRDVCSMTSTEGQCLVYVLLLCRTPEDPGFSNWKLLEFRLNNESGKLDDSAVVDSPGSESNCLNRVNLYDGRSPFLFIPTWPRAMVFDTRTRALHELPEFHVARVETLGEAYQGKRPLGNQMVFTDTHLISFVYFDPPRDHPIVIQVFTLPLDGSPVNNGIPPLRLTHEGIANSLHPNSHVFFGISDGVEEPSRLNVRILKSSVDPLTGTTNVGLLDYARFGGDFLVTRIDLTLPEPSAVDVLPMTVDTQLFNFSQDILSKWHHEDCFQCIDISNDGHVRGFSKQIPEVRIFDPAQDDQIVRFTIDTTQDRWVITCGELLAAEWNHIHDMSIDIILMFDGMRGRLCFEDPVEYRTIIVMDID